MGVTIDSFVNVWSVGRVNEVASFQLDGF